MKQKIACVETHYNWRVEIINLKFRIITIIIIPENKKEEFSSNHFHYSVMGNNLSVRVFARVSLTSLLVHSLH